MEFISHTMCVVFHPRSSLMLCAFEWLQCSSSWWVAVLNKVSQPKVSPTPSLSSPYPPPPLLGLRKSLILMGALAWERFGVYEWHDINARGDRCGRAGGTPPPP